MEKIKVISQIGFLLLLTLAAAWVVEHGRNARKKTNKLNKNN